MCVFHSVWMLFCSVPQIFFTPALSSVTSIPCLCDPGSRSRRVLPQWSWPFLGVTLEPGQVFTPVSTHRMEVTLSSFSG